MADTATKETPQTRATLRYLRTSAYKVREVLDLIRGLDVDDARHVLQFSERGPAREVLKVLNSAVANADHTLNIPADELKVAVAFADEGPTIKRWRPRARGRATRIRKRTCHITIIVSRLSDAELQQRRRRDGASGTQRRRGVIPGRRRKATETATSESGAPKAGKGKAAEAAAPEEEAAAPEAEPAEAPVAETEGSAEEKAARYEKLGREEASAAQGDETVEERVAPYVAEEAEAEGEAAADAGTPGDTPEPPGEEGKS
jgi:large subunit ribosomal protein L22